MPDYVGLTAQDWGNSLCRALEDMWRHSVVCDTVIYANDGQTFNAHAAVLMASSPYLKTLLWTMKKQVFSVEINTISSDTWTALLNFFYTGKSTVERKQLETMLEASEKLEIPELTQLCLQQLNNQPLAPGDSDPADIVQDLSSKEQTDSPTDLSMKTNVSPVPPAPATTITPPQVPPTSVPRMWISPQMRPVALPPQWSLPFVPNMQVPPGFAPFIGTPANNSTRQPSVIHPAVSQSSKASLPQSGAENKDEDLTKRHQCRVCHKRFKLRHVLQQHELTHTNLKPYYCDICGFRARQKAVIWKHKKLKHGKEENIPIKVSEDDGAEYLQEELNFSEFDTSPSEKSEAPVTPYVITPTKAETQHASTPPPPLNQPSLTESPSSYYGNARQYICPVCNKSFRNKHVLAQHELIHSNFRPYACDYCNFRAKQKAVIWRHIKVKHADMKEVSYRTESPPKSTEVASPEVQQPKQIEEAKEVKRTRLTFGKRVNSVIDRLKTSLTTRRKSKSYDLKCFDNEHPPTLVPLPNSGPVSLTGYSFIRRFQCRTCNKVFKNKHILLQHELVHSNLRPYKCQFCGFRAKQKAVMWRHLKSRHPEKGRVRIVEDIDLSLIRESSNYKPHEMEMDAMKIDSTFDEFSNTGDSDHMLDEDVSMDMDEIPNDDYLDEEEDEDLDDYDAKSDDSDDENEGDAHFCQTCGKGFNDKDAMEKHEQRHSAAPVLNCEKCEYKTRKQENLERHVLKKHSDQSLPVKNFKPSPNFHLEGSKQEVSNVDLKLDETKVDEDLQDEIQNHIPAEQKLYYCNMCDFCTRHQTSLSRHKRLKHENEIKSDDLQGNDALSGEESNKASLPQHNAAMNLSSKSEPGSPAVPPSHLMNFCLQQNPVRFQMFPSQSVMPVQMHIQNQQQQQQQQQIIGGGQIGGDPDKRFMCNVCGRGFKHRHVLHQHSLVHTDLKPYACEFCNFRGRQKASLWRHRQKHLAEMGKGYMPPNKDLFGNEEFSMDNSEGSSPKPVDFSTAPVFPGSSPQNDDESMNEDPDDGLLLAEEYAEDGEEDLSGEEDMEAYSEEVDIDEKQEACVVATADGQHACSLCGKVSSSKMAIQRHVLTHRSGKCYKCPTCTYQTAYSFALQRHIRVHKAGEQPFTCEICDKTFTDENALNTHKVNEHVSLGQVNDIRINEDGHAQPLQITA